MVQLGHIQLAVDNPQQYREQVLKIIKKEIKQVKDILEPSGKISVSGLENPVIVGQADDQNVELFIKYTLSIAGKTK